MNIGTYTISSGDNLRVWTTMPNGQNEPAGVAYNDTTGLLVKEGISGNYTVGGAAADYADFAAAVADLNAFGVCGPVTLTAISGSGPYTEKLEFSDINGASATNTITLNGNGEKLIFNGASGNRAGVLFNGCKWVTVKNFDLDASSATTAYGVQFTGNAEHNTLKDNIIRMNTSSTSSLVCGIIFSNSQTSPTTTGDASSYNTVEGNTVYGGYYALSVFGASTTSPSLGNKILNNTFENFYYRGAYTYYQEDIEINGNIFKIRPGYSSPYGIAMYYNNDFLLANNQFIGCYYGLYCYYGNYYRTLTNSSVRSVVANNFFANAHISGYYGIYITTNSRNIDVVNNSVYWNSNAK
ncbi:MAG: right-handed parallel beta-helix repeat-containing protein [Bacteroidia bacterium]